MKKLRISIQCNLKKAHAFITFRFIPGIAKASVLWYKKDVFSQQIKELVGFWPIPPLDEEAQAIKDRSLAALRMAQKCKYKNTTRKSEEDVY